MAIVSLIKSHVTIYSSGYMLSALWCKAYSTG